jgi:hypothetical protein
MEYFIFIHYIFAYFIEHRIYYKSSFKLFKELYIFGKYKHKYY